MLPAVGYTNADQSHFTSRHYWEVGATDAHLRTGWLGRYLDVAGAMDNPLQGLALSGSLHPALASANVPVACVSRIDDYDFWASGVWGPVQQRMLGRARHVPAGIEPGDRQGRRGGDARSRDCADSCSRSTAGTGAAPSPTRRGRNAFPARLAGLAAIIHAGPPLRCVSITAPGMYDTHSDQAGELTNSLALTANTLRAFQRDLEARGIADRVLVHVWSEFGRRGEENGSGTDHGAAGIGLLIGTRVRGQMLGEFPGLETGLDDDGNLRATFDYRSLYSSLLEQWFATDAAAVIPNAAAFPRVALLR